MTPADQVVPLSVGLSPEPGVPNPILIQNEHDAYVVFDARSEDLKSSGIALVRLRQCLITRFGYPNDEALGGHPLYANGLRSYGVFEVHNSSWIAQLQEQNRRCFPGFTMPRRQHVAITFHDSTLEAITHSVEATLLNENLRSVLSRVTELLWGDG